ncbi:non-ribosomal peptide synthetase [Micromonospora sp. LOL_021]|uniref:non-ribosomal peptide synthetase n=1 Tax=Micromonospora sp. LOL_021 TaxID=3345417 RepID=UPI003A8B8F3D
MSVPESEEGLSPAKAALLRRWRAGGQLPDAHASEEQRAMGHEDPLVSDPVHMTATGPVPLTPAQRRLWFLEQLRPGSAAFNLSYCLILDRKIELAALNDALSGLARRHDILRAVIEVEDGEPRQVLKDGARPRLAVVVVDAASDAHGRAELVRRAQAAADEPIDLTTGPLAKLIVYRMPDRDALLLVVHHLIADGWALTVALRDLGELYASRVAGRPADQLVPLPTRFADVVVPQPDDDDPDVVEDQNYWRSQLAGLRPVELPADRPRPPEFSYAGDWRPVEFDTALDAAVREFARSNNATPYMVLLAALKVMISVTTGQDDVVVGGAVAGRDLPQTRDLIGNFTNTVAFRGTVPARGTFRDFLAQVRTTTLAGLAHQRLPFDQVVEQLDLPRSAAHAGPLPVLFVLQPGTPLTGFAGLPAEPVELGWRTARADLELHLREQPHLHGGLVFRTDLFDPVTGDRLAERFIATVRALLHEPKRALDSLDLLSERERAELTRWSAGPVRPIPVATVTDLVDEQLRRDPDATAVSTAATTLTYAELDARATVLAHRLIGVGVTVADPVAVCLPRGAELVVAALAVLRSGGCYLPLDPAHSEARTADALRRAGARVLICDDTALADRITGGDGAVVRLASAQSTQSAAAGGPASGIPAVHEDSPAYLIYTSGSTGAPKGVAVSHRAAVNFLLSLAEEHQFDTEVALGAVASPAFDASFAEIFGPLSVGGRVHLVDQTDTTDGKALAAALVGAGVNRLSATSTAWQLLRRTAADLHLDAMVGGERVGDDLAEHLIATQRRAWTQYGPTEAAVWATVAELRPGEPVALGRPIRNVRCYLVDEQLRQVPVGAAGELCIAGSGVAQGYTGQPGLTADRFVPDPFSDRPGQRMYRTGDYARYRPDGTLQFLGRRDEQVKLRGYRIELGDVAAACAGHPAVAECAVDMRDDPGVPDGQILVVYLVPRPDAAESGDALASAVRQRARELLPSYMVPERFVVLAGLPRTATGKLDRAALADPGPAARSAGVPFQAPRTPLEAEIAQVVEEFLQVTEVGVYDDFFELGGNSVRAAQLVVRLSDRYGVELVLQKLFASPTVDHLATLIQQGLDRRQQLTDEQEGVRRLVGDMPADKIDALLASLLTERAASRPEPRGEEDNAVRHVL